MSGPQSIWTKLDKGYSLSLQCLMPPSLVPPTLVPLLALRVSPTHPSKRWVGLIARHPASTKHEVQRMFRHGSRTLLHAHCMQAASAYGVGVGVGVGVGAGAAGTMVGTAPTMVGTTPTVVPVSSIPKRSV